MKVYKTVGPNIWMLLIRIVLLALFCFLYQYPIGKIRTGESFDKPIAFFLSFIMISMLPIYLAWTLFGVLWVTISFDNKTIRFHHFYKTIELNGSDLDGYYKTTNKTKVTIFKGILIKLKSGKVVEATEYNLKSIRAIIAFLSYNKIPLRGDKNSWFPLTRQF